MAAGTRITGKLGRVSLESTGASHIADIFEWTAEWEIDLEACGIKGEPAEQYAIGGFTGRVTAQRFSTTLESDSILAKGVLRTMTEGAGNKDATDANPYVSYVLEQVDATIGTRITGNGILRRGSVNSPRAMALDTVEILMTSIPAIVDAA